MAIRTYVDGGVLGGVLGGVGNLWRFNKVQYVQCRFNVTMTGGASQVDSPRRSHAGPSDQHRHDPSDYKRDNGRNGFAFIVRFRFDYSLPLRACAFHEAF